MAFRNSYWIIVVFVNVFMFDSGDSFSCNLTTSEAVWLLPNNTVFDDYRPIRERITKNVAFYTKNDEINYQLETGNNTYADAGLRMLICRTKNSSQITDTKYYNDQFWPDGEHLILGPKSKYLFCNGGLGSSFDPKKFASKCVVENLKSDGIIRTCRLADPDAELTLKFRKVPSLEELNVEAFKYDNKFQSFRLINETKLNELKRTTGTLKSTDGGILILMICIGIKNDHDEKISFFLKIGGTYDSFQMNYVEVPATLNIISSDENFEETKNFSETENSKIDFRILVAIICGFVVVGFFVFFAIRCYLQRSRSRKTEDPFYRKIGSPNFSPPRATNEYAKDLRHHHVESGSPLIPGRSSPVIEDENLYEMPEKKLPNLPRELLEFMGKISDEGQSSYVFYGELQSEGDKKKKVAVKVLKRGMDVSELLAEGKIMMQLDHENVLKCIGATKSETNPNSLYLLCELANEGCLEKILSSGNFLDEKMSLRIQFEIASGLEYLKEVRIVHRDLALRNIFVCGGIAKIGDFGLAKMIPAKSDHCILTNVLVPKDVRAPENWPMLGAAPIHHFKSDLWAFGFCLYAIYNKGNGPWKSLPSAEDIEVIEFMPNPPSEMPEEISILMRRCFAFDEPKKNDYGEFQHQAQHSRISIEKIRKRLQNILKSMT